MVFNSKIESSVTTKTSRVKEIGVFVLFYFVLMQYTYYFARSSNTKLSLLFLFYFIFLLTKRIVVRITYFAL
jgi:hypothetical protein